MEPKKLYRVREGRMLCGVCLGVAEYLNMDVTIVRILWAAAALCGSLGFWGYFICAVIFPDKPPMV